MEELLQNEKQEKKRIYEDFEESKKILMNKVSELNSEVARVLSQSDQEISRLKIDGFKNIEQIR